MSSRWESYFKLVLSVLLSVVAFIGVVLWNKVDTLSVVAGNLTETTSRLDGSIRVETQARGDLSTKVDGMAEQVQVLSTKLDTQAIPQTVPQADKAAASLDKKIDKLSTQMYHLQSQMDEEQAARNEKKAKAKQE